MVMKNGLLGRLSLSILALTLTVSLVPEITRAAARPETVDSTRAAVNAAINRVRPALVRIHVVSTDYRDGRELKTQAVGSGAIISKDGYLITNHHVAGHGARMICTLSDREEIEAELIGTDPLTDISVLKLKPENPRKFAAAVFGDSSKLRVGDTLLAMGSPMALSQSVTLGILSNLEMMMPRFFGPGRGLELDGEDVGSLVKWLGHDAAIYGGNSGGPLVNLKGEIIGINELQFGLSGAIPGNLARAVAEELIRNGKVRRSWIGIDAQPLFRGAKDSKGVLISGVISDSPADHAGLQSGDLLLEMAGKPTNVRYEEEMPEFMRVITSLPIGTEVPARILRAGAEKQVEIRAVERGELNPPERELKHWGITVRELSYLTSREMKRTNQLGALITSVRAGGPSGEAKPSLRTRDVIVKVNDTPIRNKRDLAVVTEGLVKNQSDPVPVIVTFERESRHYMTVVRLGLQELRDPGLEVSKAWLPVETQVISREIARELKKPDLTGFYITQVYPRTSAEKAGLKPGDFILAVDGEKLRASGPEHEEEFAALIRQYDIGATVQLTVLRDLKELKVSTELTRSPKLRREMKKYRNDDFEFTVRDIAFFDVAEEQWKPDQRGVLVEEVKSGSWAELGSLDADDLIVSVDGEPVKDSETLKSIMERIARERRPWVVMKVLRGIHTAFLEFEPAWKPGT